MNIISGFGLIINVVASNTFPAGFVLSEFSDDADPFDIPAIDISDSAMTMNGDLLVWSKANKIDITLNVIPDSDDDRNLSILFGANRVQRGKQSAQDIITMTPVYPSGKKFIVQNGFCKTYMPGLSVASAGRLKTKPYTFTFEGLL